MFTPNSGVVFAGECCWYGWVNLSTPRLNISPSSIAGRGTLGRQGHGAGGGRAGTGAAPAGSSALDDGGSYDASSSAARASGGGVVLALPGAAAARLPLPRSPAAARQARGTRCRRGQSGHRRGSYDASSSAGASVGRGRGILGWRGYRGGRDEQATAKLRQAVGHRRDNASASGRWRGGMINRGD